MVRASQPTRSRRVVRVVVVVNTFFPRQDFPTTCFFFVVVGTDTCNDPTQRQHGSLIDTIFPHGFGVNTSIRQFVFVLLRLEMVSSGWSLVATAVVVWMNKIVMQIQIHRVGQVHQRLCWIDAVRILSCIVMTMQGFVNGIGGQQVLFIIIIIVVMVVVLVFVVVTADVTVVMNRVIVAVSIAALLHNAVTGGPKGLFQHAFIGRNDLIQNGLMHRDGQGKGIEQDKLCPLTCQQKGITIKGYRWWIL
mmetsp:Transcript_8109/g.16320  ORF Transcript_8109/g.16320 Transcript_8109/m.16320 type:complete len:248 (+) Transcript_8109:1851-2594(+)